MNSTSRAAAAVLLAAHLMGVCAGCRTPDRPGDGTIPIGLHYDTAYGSDLAAGRKIPWVEAAWEPYVETLAEPVAILNCRDGVSTWEVFFATNRGLVASTAGTDQEDFGSEVLSVPQYGRAVVTIPPRKRGVEPDPARMRRRRTPLGGRRTPTGSERVRFESVSSTPHEDFLAGVDRQVRQSRQHDLLVFVHGFNVDFRSALARAAQVSLDLPFNGAVVAYCWPTQGGVLNYEADGPVNARSTAPFLEFLTGLIAALPEGTRINLLVHSMGNRFVMEALDRMPPPTGSKPLANVVLCAPDVGLSDFDQWAPGVVEQSEHVTLYANEDDNALKTAMRVLDEPRAGDADPPVVVPGIETVDCSSVEFSFLGHNYFGSNADVLADMFAVIKEQKSADERPHLISRDVAHGGRYWEFRDSAPQVLWTWHFAEPADAAPDLQQISPVSSTSGP